jgi:hypothetical protein
MLLMLDRDGLLVANRPTQPNQTPHRTFRFLLIAVVIVIRHVDVRMPANRWLDAGCKRKGSHGVTMRKEEGTKASGREKGEREALGWKIQRIEQ